MATEDARKLFMAGLPDSVTEEVLRGLFSETNAQVTELTLPRDRATGRPRGFAFVRLNSEDEAERARQELDGRIVDGKMISVRPFHADPPTGRAERGGPPRGEGERSERPDRGPRPDRGGGGGGGGGPGGGPPAPDRTLYVGNLPYDASQEDVEGLMRNLGAEPPARVYLPLDQDGRKRGFGFVTMNSAEAANAALKVLGAADLRGRRLIVNIAHPKESRPPRGDGPSGGFGDRPPRSFSGPPSGGPSGFGPPGGLRSGKNDGRRRKDDGERGAAKAGKRDKEEREERWREQDDDDY